MSIFEIQEKSQFAYLRVNYLHLGLIDWKKFDYPTLSAQRYTERNGQNEMEEIVTVKVHVAGIDLRDGSELLTHIILYRGTAAPQVWSALIRETHLFNTDPKKYWKDMLTPLLEKSIEISKESRRKAKKQEKRLRKALDSLNGLDKP